MCIGRTVTDRIRAKRESFALALSPHGPRYRNSVSDRFQAVRRPIRFVDRFLTVRKPIKSRYQKKLIESFSAFDRLMVEIRYVSKRSQNGDILDMDGLDITEIREKEI